MPRDYIPSNNSDFMAFQATINAEVTANAVTWSIPATEATALDTWSTGYQPLFEAIVNKNTRSREDVIAHDAYRKNYVAFLRPFCQGFLTNNPVIPIGERVAMGLNPRGLNPPSKRPDIDSAPITALTPMGGGMVKFSFKVAASDKRTARHPDSNGVEVFYKLEDLAPVNAPLNDALLEEDLVVNAENADSDYDHIFNTRAQFKQELGLENVGKRLTVYARWVNTTDSSKNGPYSTITSLVVS